MHGSLLHPVLPLALAAVLAVAACDASSASAPAPTPVAAVSEAPGATGTPGASQAAGPTLTPVPGGASGSPGPIATPIGTAQTDWGTILVALPDSFPMPPGAGIVDLPEVTTASFAVPLDLDGATAWYRDTLTGLGYRVELSDPLEDGARVMDVFSDLPECRIQIAFRPDPDSTIITVLYGAGCAGHDG